MVVFFVMEILPIEVTAMGAIGFLLLFDVLTWQEAISGFSNPAVITIGAIFIMSRALVKTAILKSKSPSCGIGKIYDGSFTKTLKTGDGIFAHLCHENNIECISSDNINQIKKTLAKLK